MIRSIAAGVFALVMGAAGLAAAEGPRAKPKSQSPLYGGVEFLYLHRSGGDRTVATSCPVDPPGSCSEEPSGSSFHNEALNTGDVGGFGPGGRLFVGWRLPKGGAWELGFLYVRTDQSAQVTDPNENLHSAFRFGTAPGSVLANNSGDFGAAFRHELDLKTDLISVELVRRQPVRSGRFWWSAGGRFILLKDQLTFTGFDELDDLGGDPGSPVGVTDVARYRIRTENFLFGPQIGGGGTLVRAGPFGLAFDGKLGVFANYTRRRYQFLESFGAAAAPDGLNDRKNAWRFSAASEARMALNLTLKNDIKFSVGYMVLWMYGVTTAPNNFFRSAADSELERFSTRGQALYHGAFARITVPLN